MARQVKKLNVAMIAYGFMGRAHSNAFLQVGHFFDLPYHLHLKTMCGRNRPAVEAMVAQWGWQEAEMDWRSVVERKDIDVVDICTPNHLHAEIAVAAAEAGKIVLCEKPLAMNVPEARRMAAAVRNLPNLVWFNYRRVAAIALAQELIEQGRVGDVYHYRATYLQSWGADPQRPEAWRFRKSEAGSGAIGDLLSHSLDLALMLNGQITEVTSLMQTFTPGREVDDAVLALARFANGSVGTFEATRFAIGCQNRNYFEIHGAKGALRFDLEDLNRLEVFDRSDNVAIRGSHNVLVTGPGHPYSAHFWPPGHIVGYEHTFIATLADFLTCLTNNQTFHPNFEDAVDVQLLLEAVETSAGTGAWAQVPSQNAARIP